MRMELDVVPTGKTTATVVLTQEQVDALRGSPGRSRVPLAITFDGQVFRTSISVYRGQWMMIVNEAMRAGGMTPPGVYTADVVMDTVERVVEVPADLLAAIAAAGRQPEWDTWSYTRRKEAARTVTEAKKAETRERRIVAIVEALGT